MEVRRSTPNRQELEYDQQATSTAQPQATADTHLAAAQPQAAGGTLKPAASPSTS